METRSQMLSERLMLFLASMFLMLQLGGIVYARFTEARYFCWAPYDAINLYQISVVLDDKPLSSEGALERYHLSGRDNRSIQHVKDIIQQYEENYGTHESVSVVLRYTTNGHSEQQWQWSQSN